MIICPHCYYNGGICELINKPCPEVCQGGIIYSDFPDDGVSLPVEVPCHNEDCDGGYVLEYYECLECGEDIHESKVLLISYRDGSHPVFPKEKNEE